MPDIVLQHCVPTSIGAPGPLPPEFDLVLSIGGGPLDGVVEVVAGPGELPGPVSLPTGSSTTIPCLGVTSLQLHYRKSPAGPDDVEVTYEIESS
jgi:hypothetical protein